MGLHKEETFYFTTSKTYAVEPTWVKTPLTFYGEGRVWSSEKKT